MKRVKCKSGTIGWQDKLQKQYESFDLFEAYDSNYNLAERLGFKTAKEAWNANPTIQGSTDPSDYCIAPVKRKVVYDVYFYRKSGHLIDVTQIDKKDTKLAWELFKEFKYKKSKGIYLRFEKVFED